MNRRGFFRRLLACAVLAATAHYAPALLSTRRGGLNDYEKMRAAMTRVLLYGSAPPAQTWTGLTPRYSPTNL